jgi:hypothetical protein
MKKTTNVLIKSAKLFCCISLFLSCTMYAQEGKTWIVYEGGKGLGEGKHIVFLSGDEEYRSEEAMPALAKILAYRHGFKCTVLFAINPETSKIDPDYQKNIPGLEALKDADLMIMLLRFRALPEEQMNYVLDYIKAGKPIIGMRSSTHAFLYPKESPYFKFGAESHVKGWEGGFGRQVLGETWVSHHGNHGSESTQGLVNGLLKNHPVLTDVQDVWGPTDVYGITDITGDESVLLYGQSLLGMEQGAKPNYSKSIMPVAWIKDYATESGKISRVFNTTMGAAVDLKNEGLRRLIINAAYWCLDMEMPRENNVQFVGEFNPTIFGFGESQKGLSPNNFIVDEDTVAKVLNEETNKPTARSTVGTYEYILSIPDNPQKGTLNIYESDNGFEGSLKDGMIDSKLHNFSYENGHLRFDADGGGDIGPLKGDLKFIGNGFKGTLTIVKYNFKAPIEGAQ